MSKSEIDSKSDFSYSIFELTPEKKTKMIRIFIFVIIGISAKSVEGQLSKEKYAEIANESKFKNLTNLENVFDVFDIRNVGSRWNSIYNRLSKNCTWDTEKYLNGLQTGKSWAIKMDDSTGKYNHGFFWGNNYWTGSITQCSFIYRKDGSNKNFTKIIKNTDLTYINGNYLEASDEMHENPPFIPGFYMLKILLNNTRILGPPRTVLMGLCLPGTCQLNDIVEMIRISSNAEDNFQILSVRSPTLNNFSLWKDLTFQILL